MAVTHDDLAVRQRSDDGGAVSGARGLSLIVFCVLCGLLSFILSLAAEATRSEVSLPLCLKPAPFLLLPPSIAKGLGETVAGRLVVSHHRRGRWRRE